MEALKDPDGASFSYMLPNTAIQWGPYCSDCMNSWHSDSFFPRDILIFPHTQGKSEAICLGDLELENGSTNPFKLKRSLSDLLSLNCSKKECPNSDRFIVKRSKTLKHKNVETIRLKSKGRETQTDNRKPSVKTVSTSTAAIAEVKPEKNFPFLFGNVKATDPMTDEQTWSAWHYLLEEYKTKDSTVLRDLLSESGYKIQSCVACSISFDSFDSMISHVLKKNVLKTNRRFSYSQDLRILKHLFLDMDIMKSDLRNLTTNIEHLPTPKEVAMKVDPKAKIAVKTPAIANPPKKTSGNPPKTAPSTQQKEKKKEYPFLTGRINPSDPISVTEENEAMMRLRQGINEEASILNKLLIKQGYQPTNCVPCGIPKNLSGPTTVISHAISDSHRTKIRGAGFEFSRSKDLKVLERLYEEAKSTKIKSNPSKQVAKQQKNSPSKPVLAQPAAAVAKTTVDVRVPNTLPSNLSNTSSPTLSASSGLSARQVPPPIQADLPAHTMLKFSPRIQPKFAASKGEYILCEEGKDILVSNMNDSMYRGIMTRLCGMGGGSLRDFDKMCLYCNIEVKCVCDLLNHVFSKDHVDEVCSQNGGCKAFEFWIDAFASAVDVRLDKSICWHGIKDDDGNYMRFKTLLYSPYRSRADSPPPVYYRPVYYTPAKPQPNNEEGCTIS